MFGDQSFLNLSFLWGIAWTKGENESSGRNCSNTNNGCRAKRKTVYFCAVKSRCFVLLSHPVLAFLGVDRPRSLFAVLPYMI